MEFVEYFVKDNQLHLVLNDISTNTDIGLAKLLNINDQISTIYSFVHNGSDYWIDLREIVNSMLDNSALVLKLVEVNNKTGDVKGCVLDKICDYDIKIIKVANSLLVSIKISIKNDKSVRFEIGKDLFSPFLISYENKKYNLVDADENLKFDDILICKRLNTKHDFIYSKILHLENHFPIDINKIFKQLSPYIQTNKEIWDLNCKIEGYLIPFNIEDHEKENDLVINDGFIAKPFVSDNVIPSIFIKENVHQNRKKIKIALIGSCATKDAFYSHDFFNPDYKRYFENKCIFFHQTMESLVSDPIEVDFDKLITGKNKRLLELYARKEFSKGYLSELKKYKPNYLVIDLYNESATALLVKNNCYVGDCFFFEENDYFSSFDFDRKIKPYTTEKIKLFIEAVTKFRKQISAIVPLKKIILISTYKSDFFLNKERKVVQFDKKLIDANKQFRESQNIYYSLFQSIIPECKFIDLRNVKYQADEMNPHDLSPHHLESDFYKELLNRVIRIVLEDKLGD